MPMISDCYEMIEELLSYDKPKHNLAALNLGLQGKHILYIHFIFTSGYGPSKKEKLCRQMGCID